jgi:hypothetical protein
MGEEIMAYNVGCLTPVESTSSITLDGSGEKLAFRFTAQSSKSVNKVHIYINSITGTSPTYRVGLQGDSSGEPSGTWLGATNQAYQDMTPSASGWITLTLNETASLTSGTVYHIVVQYQSGTINGSNYSSFRILYPKILYQHSNESTNNISFSDSNLARLFNSGSIWSVSPTYGPFFIIEYTDTNLSGCAMTFTGIAINNSNTIYGEQITIDTANQDVETIGFYVKKSGTPDDDLEYEIREASSPYTILRSGTLAASGDITTSYAWYDANLSSTLTLTNGNSYKIVLRSPSISSGIYYLCGLLNSSTFKIAGYGGTTNLRTYSSDAGLSWSNSDVYDISFRLGESGTISKTLTGKSKLYITQTKTITGKASLATQVEKTITGKSYLTATYTKTITGKSRLYSTKSKTITGKSKISVQVTKTLTGKSYLTGTLRKTLTGKAIIYQAQPPPTSTQPKFKIEIINGKEYDTDLNTKLLYHLNERIGTSVNDNSGNGYHGIINGTIEFQAGVFKGGYRLDDGGDYIDSGEDSAFDFDISSSSFTIEAWIFSHTSDSSGTEYNIISKNDSTSSGYRLFINSDKKPQFDVYRFGAIYDVIGPLALNDNQWYHLAGVLDTANDKVYLYIDGTQAPDFEDFNNQPSSNNYNLHIGTDASNPGVSIGDWDVWIDEVRVSNTARTTFRTYKDVSDYVLTNSKVVTTAAESIQTGALILDTNVDDVLSDLSVGNEVRIWVGYSTPSYHLFTGLIENIVENQNKYIVNFTDYGKLLLRRVQSKVYRSDLGTGNIIYIAQDTLDDKIPEIWYDSDSILTDSTEFPRYTPQAKYINEMFDYFAELLNRVWYVDKYKKLYLITRTFDDSGYTLTYGTNIIGEVTKTIDTSKWANYIIVKGQTTYVGFQETLTGDGTTTEFTLSRIPFDIEVTVDGTIQTGSFEGAYNSENADYLIDAIRRKITFVSAPGNGLSIVVKYKYLTWVYDEIPNMSSINIYGRVDKKLDLETIQTISEANTIGNNYLDLYSLPLEIYSGMCIGTTEFLSGQKVTYVNSVKGINESFNVVELTYNFGTGGFILEFKLNDFPLEFQDLFKELLLRLRRLEETDKISGEYLLIYKIWGKDIIIKLTNVKLESRDINDSMVWGHLTAANGEWGTAEWGDRRSAAVLIEQIVG